MTPTKSNAGCGTTRYWESPTFIFSLRARQASQKPRKYGGGHGGGANRQRLGVKMAGGMQGFWEMVGVWDSGVWG